MRGILSVMVLASALLCAGCASVTQGTTHTLRIETVGEKGEQVDGADCTLTNDQGTTNAKSGGSTVVRRSNQDLEIQCSASGQADAKARLVSRANVGLAGNIILGGAIGAVIDHNTGAAYTYPSWVRLVFGQFHVFDRRDEREGTAMLPASAVLAQGGAQAPPPRAEAGPVLTAAPVSASPPSPVRATVARGDTFDYRVTDRLTGQQQIVVLRADRVQAGEVSFNGGSRVESPAGTVTIRSALVGELDAVTPPAGWMPGGRMPSGTWKMAYASIVPGSPMRYELEASVEGEQRITVDGRPVRATRIGLRGWAAHSAGHLTIRARYEGVAWVSPELGRVVRFEARARSSGNTSSTAFSIDELTELVRVGQD